MWLNIVLDTHYKGSWSTHSSGQTQGMYLFIYLNNFKVTNNNKKIT